jgi:hypothetical protein
VLRVYLPVALLALQQGDYTSRPNEIKNCKEACGKYTYSVGIYFTLLFYSCNALSYQKYEALCNGGMKDFRESTSLARAHIFGALNCSR